MKRIATALAFSVLCTVARGQVIVADTYNVTGTGTGFGLNAGVNSGINPPATRLTGSAAANLRYISTGTKAGTAYSISGNKLQVASAANPGRFVLSADGVASFDFAPALGIAAASPTNRIVYDLSIRMNNDSSAGQRFSFALGTSEGDANSWDFGFQIYRTNSANDFYAVGKRIDSGSSGNAGDLNQVITTLTPNTFGNDITVLMRVTDAGSETGAFNSRVQLSFNGGNSWFYDSDNDPDLPSGWRLNGPERHIMWDVAPDAGPVTFDAFSLRKNPPSNANTTSKFRVMAYNIHWALGPDNKVNTQRIANYILDQNIDLVGFNEVARFWSARASGRDIIGEIAQQTGMSFVFSNNNTSLSGNASFGNAILSKYPIVLKDHRLLPVVGDNEQRGWLKAIVDVNGKFVSFWTTHLDFRADHTERLMCGTNFNSWLADESFPVIFCGDFNDTPNTPIYNLMEKKWTDIWPIAGDGSLGRTAPCPGFPDNLNARIDYIWKATSSTSLVPTNAFVGYGIEGSDHYPVITQFILTNFTNHAEGFYFPFDEGSGSKTMDSIGGLAGKFGSTAPTWSTNSPTGQTGDFSLFFDGTKRISVTDTNQIIGTNGLNDDYTLQAWVKLPLNYAPATRAILFQYERKPGFSISINTNRTLHTTAFKIKDVSSAATIPNDGQWHHVAVVHKDGANLKFYIDGALATTSVYANGAGYRTEPTITIGAEPDGANPFTGYLDRIRFDSFALAPSQFDLAGAPVSPPAIVMQPESLALNEGSDATFSVSASGTNLFYQWHFNSQPIAGATTSSLLLTNAQPANEGSYFATITNVAGATNSSVATLTVNLFPPTIVSQPQGKSVYQGSNVVFSVTASGTSLAYQWFFNSEPLSGATNTTLLITNARSMNAGWYFVSVSNSGGAVFSSTNNLSVIPDALRPSISVISPGKNKEIAQAEINVTGFAKDSGIGNSGIIRSVRFSLNAGMTNDAAISDLGKGVWSFASMNPVTLTPGTNSLVVWASDLAGNETNISVPFFYDLTNTLTLHISNKGKVKMGTTVWSNATTSISNVFKVGRPYRIDAFVDKGTNCIFTNWFTEPVNVGTSTNVWVQKSSLSFVMQENMVIHANFVTNPFTAVAGSYNGLFSDRTNGVSHETSGFIQVKVKDKSTYSGVAVFDGNRIPFSGKFNADGTTTREISRVKVPGNKLPVTLSLAVDLSPDGESLSGTLSATNGEWVSEIFSDKTVFNDKSHPYLLNTDFAGNYTMQIPAGVGAPLASPGGIGYGAISNSPGGIVKLTGALGDGHKLTQKMNLSRDGLWPLYAGLYKNSIGEYKGSVIGWIQFATNSGFAPASNNVVTWIKKDGSESTARYANGFTNAVELLGSTYVAPGEFENPINLVIGTITLKDGNLPTPVTNVIYSVTNKKVTVSPTGLSGVFNGMTLTFNKKNGVFTGNFLNPTARTNFSGVLLQNQTNAAGYFLGPSQSGSVRVTK